MTLRNVMAPINRALFRLKKIRRSRKQLIGLIFATLMVASIGAALNWWWFRSLPISYHWGSYVSCPESWIDGAESDWKANPLIHLKGGEKTKPWQAAEHMTACGVPFARDSKHRKKLIKSGALVRLTAPHATLVNISEPYLNPLMLIFATRLSDQYYTNAKNIAGKSCGKLIFTSALRNMDSQRKLSNGSRASVHPTGMSFDLRIPTDKACNIWLVDTLLNIERNGRADATLEEHPRHYHVVLIPGAYEAWRMQELGITHDLGYDLKEVHALTTALYFESAIDEPRAGIQAIASVIKNRRGAKAFPDSIEGVIKQGARGQKNGGCQFSFMCDGVPEQPHRLCELHPKDMPRLWPDRYPCGKRWLTYYKFALEFMTAPDNTGGALHYYTGKKPWWADEEMPHPKKIGSHNFG